MPNFTHKRKSVSRLMVPVALAIALAGCSSSSLYNQAPSNDITAAAVQSSAAYLSKAQSSQGTERINLEILAVKAMIQEGEWQSAEQWITTLSHRSMTPMQIAEWQLARAAIRYHDGQYQEALNSLNFQPSWQLANSQYKRYYLFRIELLEKLHQGFQAARERCKLDYYLNPDQRAANWAQLWHDLSGYSDAQLSSFKIPSDESVLKGWVELAMLKNSTAPQPGKLKAALKQWLNSHPYHPANQYLPAELSAIMNLKIVKYNKIALLLPLSGAFAEQGKAVRDGFINAMMDDSGRGADTVLNIYNTNVESMPTIMAKLEQNGTQFVVGPLLKDKIIQYQQDDIGNINTLVLNMPPDISKIHPNICYFSLSPEQEAVQAAERIYQQGHRNPVIVVPENSFGERVSAAFNQEWEKLTSQPAVVANFGSRAEIPQQIKTIFGGNAVPKSDDAPPPTPTEVGPGHNADAIYLVASKSNLLMLKPFIEASMKASATPPTFYTSSRSNLEQQADTPELRGIEFSDIPLLIDPPAGYIKHFNQLWPNQGNTGIRLHAFGMDAYKLSTDLQQMRLMPDFSIQGATGKLSLNNQCVVQRQIDWATFTRNGVKPAK